MNAYYHNSRDNNSNNDIFRAYFLGSAKPAPTWKRYADSILAVLVAIISVLTCSTARRLLRVFSVAALLVAFIGLIGAMESGTLGLGMGFLIGLTLLGLEFLTLRKL